MALGRLAQLVVGRLVDATVDRRHRLAGKDHDEGPAGTGTRRCRTDGRPRGLAERRARRSAHGAARRRGHALPRPGDGRPGNRPHPATSPRSRRPTSRSSSTSGSPTSGSSAAGRRPRRPRASWSRPCSTTASRSSTPTTRWYARWQAAPPRPSVLVGLADDAAVRAAKVWLDDRGRPAFELVTPARQPRSTPEPRRPPLRHERARGRGRGARGRAWTSTRVAERLSAAVPQSRWRMEVSERADGVTIVNDAYNANPDSMRAALQTLPALATGRRTWAVLGEMLELGPASTDEARGRRQARGRSSASRAWSSWGRAPRRSSGAAPGGRAAGLGLRPATPHRRLSTFAQGPAAR